MIKGLRKKPSYDELINEVDKDFITKYPDRRATNIENSNYMSQLRQGFQELIEQENKIVGENVKQLLLKEEAESGGLSHQELKSGAASFKSVESHPKQFAIHTPRFKSLIGPDVQPEIMFQALEQEKELQHAVEKQQQRKQDIISNLRHVHQGVRTRVDDMVKPDVDMQKEVDELMSDVNRYATPALQILSPEFAAATDQDVFKGVFTKNIFKQEDKKEKPMKKEKKEKKVSKTKTIKKKGSVKEHSESEGSPTAGAARRIIARDAPEPEIEHPRGSKGRPKGSKNKVKDDDVEISQIKLNENKEMSYWKSQSANEIRNQLKLRGVPSSSKWIYKKDLLKIVSDLIKQKDW